MSNIETQPNRSTQPQGNRDRNAALRDLGIVVTAVAVGAGICKLSSDQIQSSVYPGELPFNNLRESYTGDNLMNEVKKQLVADFNRGDRVDSTATSLFNPFGKPWNPDPLKEGGMGLVPNDVNNFRNIVNVLNSDIAVNATGYINENGLYVIGVSGNANDRDAMAAYLATGLTNIKKPYAFRDVVTVRGALANPNTAYAIAPYQNQIFSRIQKQFLGISKEETKRRKEKVTTDASAEINVSLQKPDQWLSCDVYRKMDEAEKQTREDQFQDLRLVNHSIQDKNNFYFSDIRSETVFMVVSIDVNGRYGPKGNWKAYEGTLRGYDGYKKNTKPVIANQIKSAVGDQTLPCGVFKPQAAEETPMSTFPGTRLPQTPALTPTRFRATENPTSTAQNPEPTATPGATHQGTPTQPPTPTPGQGQSTQAPTYTPRPGNTPTPFGS